MGAGRVAAADGPVIIEPLADLPTRFSAIHQRFDNAALLYLKVTAFVLMLADHADWLLGSGQGPHANIGRLVFPLFGFVLALNLSRVHPDRILTELVPRALRVGVIAAVRPDLVKAIIAVAVVLDPQHTDLYTDPAAAPRGAPPKLNSLGGASGANVATAAAGAIHSPGSQPSSGNARPHHCPRPARNAAGITSCAR